MSGSKETKRLIVVPSAANVGLKSISLGLVRVLQREGLSVGFAKPVAPPAAGNVLQELSAHFAEVLCHVEMTPPLAYAYADDLVRKDQLSSLMEEVVNVVETASAEHDVVVIEGLSYEADAPLASQLNLEMAKCLMATAVVVVKAGGYDARQLAEIIELEKMRYSNGKQDHFAGAVINRIPEGEAGDRLLEDLKLLGNRVPLIATVRSDRSLDAPRLLDVIEDLGLTVVRPGTTMGEARVRQVAVAGSAVENAIAWLRPDVLLVSSGDRSDIILAASLAHLKGIPLAGILLTCGRMPAESIASLTSSTQFKGLTLLASGKDTYETSVMLGGLSRGVTKDDPKRMERIIDAVTDRIDTAYIKKFIKQPDETRLTPPAFRYRLIQSAREAGKRIVLPEGDEPRTLQAAAICHQKHIAKCVLLGDPARIREVADMNGVTLPEDIDIVDALAVRNRYVGPLVEMRKNKGLTAQEATDQLEDTVVLGTMMLALGEVDGLVSGAVHTTANTVRPALQLIKTAPGQKIVSSVFFMLMPDQVLVYGDCAINPNPTAEELADIAIQSAHSAKAFGVEPRVAMISYSTGTSGSGQDVEKVTEATRLAKERAPELLIDGPMQYDAASVESVGRQKAPGSAVAGQANVFVFPDLNTGNTTYKAVQRSANVVSVGPMLQGLRKPVNDLSRGALVDDIVYTIALTAIQAM
jgi:phosphate acetyltransferase